MDGHKFKFETRCMKLDCTISHRNTHIVRVHFSFHDRSRTLSISESGDDFDDMMRKYIVQTKDTTYGRLENPNGEGWMYPTNTDAFVKVLAYHAVSCFEALYVKMGTSLVYAAMWYRDNMEEEDYSSIIQLVVCRFILNASIGLGTASYPALGWTPPDVPMPIELQRD
jgi:hypothetical protein